MDRQAVNALGNWFAAPFPDLSNDTTARLASLEILVVEDNSDNRELLDLILSGFVCSIDFVEDGQQALHERLAFCSSATLNYRLCTNSQI